MQFTMGNEGHSFNSPVTRHKDEQSNWNDIECTFLPAHIPIVVQLKHTANIQPDPEKVKYIFDVEYNRDVLTVAMYWLCNEPSNIVT